MKRIRITAICVSLITALSMVGCMSNIHHQGMHRSGFMHSSGFAHSGQSFGCDPCMPVMDIGCGSVLEFGHGFCASPKVVDCKSAFANLSNGAFLTGRGILDITAAPFVIVGNLLSGNYRYDVFASPKRHHFANFANPCHQVIGACCSAGSFGCDTCAGGFTEGIRYNMRSQSQSPARSHHQASTLPPPPPRLSNPVIQASHQTPSSSVRFVQPVR